MLTNICLGTTIFTFAVKAKTFGLVWFLVACLLVAVVNYWTITRGVLASSKCDNNDDYSEIVEQIMGKKMRNVLNFFMILYSYACIMCFLALIFPLFGFLGNLFKNTFGILRDIFGNFWNKKFGDGNYGFHVCPYGCGRPIPNAFKGCTELLQAYPNYFN